MSTVSLSDLIRNAGFKLVDIASNAGVHKSRVTRWLQTDVPAERVLELERFTGIARHLIRPDIYPSPRPPFITQDGTSIPRPD